MEEDLVKKYKQRMEKQLELKANVPSSNTFSREYKVFRKELLPARLSYYEKLCNAAESILHLKVKGKSEKRLKQDLATAHLQVTPSGVMSASIVFPSLLMIIGVFTSLLLFDSMFFALFSIMVGITGIIILQKVPGFLANAWRMKGSNQMVLCIFYVVTYMRHTSNLELAIEFASEHLQPPLSLDLRKVIWDVENGKFESIKQSLDSYLEGWREYNLEFVESFHLVQSSLYETSEERRLSLLDKALDVILDETYEKMLHYAQNLKGPLTMLHMLGVILPILGLVILPLVVSFMEGIAWYHIAVLYNAVIPIAVYFLGKNVLAKRPTGYGDTDITENNPELKKQRNIVFKIAGIDFTIHPAFIALVLGVGLLLLALSPLIIHSINPDYEFSFLGFDLLGYRTAQDSEAIIGPYGLGASVMSLFFPAAFALSLGLYFRLRSKNVIAIRKKSKQLEEEFSSALFQLGNRLGDGLPAEIAIPKVADVMKDTTSGNFFRLVATNISKLGMSVQDAMFNPKSGAVVAFPSAIIQSSMKVMIESVKKGPLIAAQALLNVARYVKEIHKVNERLKDLMADIISDMKSQIAFLTPMIAGIVIGITSMITYILGNLGKQITQLGTEEVAGQIGALSSFFGDSIPTYYFQAVVGLYVFQIVYILTILSNGIENGADSLQERYLLGRNLVNSTMLYCFIACAVMILFNFIAYRIVSAAVIAG